MRLKIGDTVIYTGNQPFISGEKGTIPDITPPLKIGGGVVFSDARASLKWKKEKLGTSGMIPLNQLEAVKDE